VRARRDRSKHEMGGDRERRRLKESDHEEMKKAETKAQEATGEEKKAEREAKKEAKEAERDAKREAKMEVKNATRVKPGDVEGEEYLPKDGVPAFVVNPPPNPTGACAGGLVDCVAGYVRGSNPPVKCSDASACNGACCGTAGSTACDDFTGMVCKDSISCIGGSNTCKYANVTRVVGGCNGVDGENAPVSSLCLLVSNCSFILHFCVCHHQPATKLGWEGKSVR